MVQVEDRLSDLDSGYPCFRVMIHYNKVHLQMLLKLCFQFKLKPLASSGTFASGYWLGQRCPGDRLCVLFGGSIWLLSANAALMLRGQPGCSREST